MGFLKTTHVQEGLAAFENPTFCFVVGEQERDQSYESDVDLIQQIEKALQSTRGPDNIWFKSKIQSNSPKEMQWNHCDEVLAEHQHLHQRPII